jgi:hypothetical protein
MAYQMYRIGERARVGGVDGYSTIRTYLQPGLYEPKPLLARRPLASPTRIARTVATGASRSSPSAKALRQQPTRALRLAGHPPDGHERKTEDVPRPPRADGRANAREAEGHGYSADAVQRKIAKDRRIKPNEASLIHALLPDRA